MPTKLEVVMNYLKHYCNLIRKAEKRGYSKKKAKEQGLYVEGHHTFPVSIYGKNKRIVYLTAREHYIAHTLLEKICIKRYGMKDRKTHKMIWAHIMMIGKNKISNEEYYNSYLYESAKLRISKIEIPEETRRKMSKHRKKSKWWNNGKETKFCEECPGPEWVRGRPGINVDRKYSQETIEKMRKKATGRKINEGSKRKLSIRSKNRIWWNNGIEDRFVKECPGDEWKRGRITKGFYWWNNGVKNIVKRECPGDGWVRGRLKNKTSKNLKWWNNGVENALKKECPGDGWKRGKIPEGTYWWNNGEKNIKSKECPGDNWNLGLLKKRTTKNLKWWNNGVENALKKECPGDGWVPGLLKKLY